MRLKKLTDDEFSGYIGGISRRVLLNELAENRYSFQTKWHKFVKYLQYGILAVLLLFMAFMSGYTLGDTIAFDKGYKACLLNIMKEHNK